MSRDVALLFTILLTLIGTNAGADQRYGLGKPIGPEELAGWDIDVRPDGKGLPPGKGSVNAGNGVFAEACSSCHGERGEGGPMDRLTGGFKTLSTDNPVRTVGSYWPYATTLFDYIRRAMPFNAPQSLTDDQVYAVVAYILFLNDIVPDGTELDAQSLPKIRMPNRDGFIEENLGKDKPTNSRQ